MSQAPFIWIEEQAHDHSYDFRKLVSQGPSKRDDGLNRWYLFRYEFNLREQPVSAPAKITVDGRYQLFVNQKRIARGPIRCNPVFQRYDEIDISPYVKIGKNVIGLLVHVYGKDTAWYQKSLDYWQTIFGDGCVYLDAVLNYTDNQPQKLQSSADWKYLQAKSWKKDTPPSGWGQDFIEKFDAEKFPSNWLSEDFNDADWRNSVELVYRTSEVEKKMGWNDIRPFPILTKNNLPGLIENKIYANILLDLFKVTPNLELPFYERIYQEEFSAIQSVNRAIKSGIDNLVKKEGVTEVTTDSDNDLAIVLKFEQLETGYPFISLTAKGGEEIEVAVSESLPGEFSKQGVLENRLAINSHLDCKHLFCYKAKAGEQTFEKFEWTAVRYLVLVIRNATRGVVINEVGVNSTLYPLQNQGSFHSSDPTLNRLWKLGANTIKKCSHDAWEDCPSREKRQWIGDGFVRFPASLVCFGSSSLELDRLYLQQAAESQRSDGLLQMFAPGDHHYHGIVIPDFSLHWINCLHHYLWYTNDIETVAQYFSTLDKIINWYCLNLNSNGMLSDLPHWQFIEWANIEREGQATTINALFAGALIQTAFIAEAIGNKSAAKKYSSILEKIKNNLNQFHWDWERKIYIDGCDLNGVSNTEQVSQHANILMIVYDLAPKERWDKIIDYITDYKRVKLTATPPVVMEGGEFDLQHDVVKCNTFFSHFLYTALAKTNRFSVALDLFKKNYGPMLATDTTTLWESFSPDASLCHAFSASPVYHLSKELLGVIPIKVGFSEVLISPHFKTVSLVKGKYPTMLGSINIEWSKENGVLKIAITIPKGMKAILELNREELRLEQFSAKVYRKKLSVGHQVLEFSLSQ